MEEDWDSDSISPQIGRTAIITGGLEGQGLEVARELAHNGAKVILCSDDVLQGEEALMYLRSRVKGAHVRYENVDLANLDSVKDFADRFLFDHDQLHILINNAEIKSLPERMSTVQGHEMIFGVNYLAHFALTARLFPLLSKTTDSRVVFLSSMEHEKAVIDFFDPESTHLYDSSKAYAQSKLALLIFAKELDRRVRESQLEVKSIPVHSGRLHTPVLAKVLHFALGRGQNPASHSVLFAATCGEAAGGHFYGPSWRTGHCLLMEEECAPYAKDVLVAERLWQMSEEMSAVKFDLHDMSNVLPFQMRGNIQPESFT